MSAKTVSSPSATAAPVKELTLTRVFNAPRSLVFKVWTEAEHLAKWWGPHHFTNTVHKLDARPGGAIRVDMRSPDGTVYPMGGMFEQIEEPYRLVFITTALDAVTGTVYLKLQNIVTFTEHNGRTTMTLHAAVTEATPEGAFAIQGMEAGWTQSIERLNALLQNYLKAPSSMNHAFSTGTEDREITGSRIFNTPRELVFKMWTDREHIVNWWGPTGFRNTIFEMDVRTGGKWRHIMHGPDGVDYKNESIYLEVVPPERLVYQHVSAPGHLSTVTFEDLGSNKTKVSMHMLFETAEIRDTTVKVFNAIEGLQQTLQRLADQLAIATI